MVRIFSPGSGPDSNLVQSVLRIKVPKYWSGPDFGPDNKTIINILTALLTSLKIGPFQNLIQFGIWSRIHSCLEKPDRSEIVIFEFSSFLKSLPIICPKRVSDHAPGHKQNCRPNKISDQKSEPRTVSD